MKAPKRIYIVIIENECGVRCTVVREGTFDEVYKVVKKTLCKNETIVGIKMA